MSGVQFGITIAACTAATMLTRFLPFLIFSSKDQQPPEVVRYLGRVLPAAIFGMLILYCLKGVSVFTGSHGCPLQAARSAMCCWYSLYFNVCTAKRTRRAAVSFFLPTDQ